MNFHPTNRYLLVKKEDYEDANKSRVLLPKEYEKKEIYGCYQVLAQASDCKGDYTGPHSMVAVLNSMVETIEVAGNKFLVILENHVIGYLEAKC
tara:strand:+ start:125 stop:406 length:282 start_codon:yes stop_codon:yes gene_type:complete